MRKWNGLLCAVCAPSLFLSACGGGAPEDSVVPAVEAGGESSTETAAGEASGASEDTETQEITAESVREQGEILVLLPSDDLFSEEEAEILTERLDGGAYSVEIEYYDEDPELLEECFSDAEEDGVRMILLDAVFPEESLACVREARDAGIPVITMNYGLGATGYALGQVITDRHDPVLTLAAWYAEEAGEESRYLILTGEADGLAGDSITAFRDGLRKAANVEEVLEISAEAEEEEELYEALSEAFSEEDVDTAVCCDSSGVRAVLDVLDGEDLTDIRILCLNGDGAGEELLDGDIDMAVIKPSEELAKQAAVLASAYLKNGNTGTAECMYREAQLLYYDSGTEELAALRQGRKAEE